MTPNGTNLGLFKISFSTFWARRAQNVLKLILKSPRFVSFGANLSRMLFGLPMFESSTCCTDVSLGQNRTRLFQFGVCLDKLGTLVNLVSQSCHIAQKKYGLSCQVVERQVVECKVKKRLTQSYLETIWSKFDNLTALTCWNGWFQHYFDKVSSTYFIFSCP